MDTRARTHPFPGLRPFMQEEADLFFGRDQQRDERVRRLANRRFLAVVGTSGSGQSSLVRAGLLPSLEGGFMAEAGTHWRMAILRPQDDPIGFLARAIVETRVLAHLDLAPPAAEGVVETTLRRSSLGVVEAARLARLEPHENLLILVDQVEELFRFADLARQRGAGDEAPAFVKLLLEAARQTDVPVSVVITMRSDFLGDCARFRDLPEAISDSQYLIPRLTRDERQAVITGPIGVRDGHIAPSLVQRLLNDSGDDMDPLPVLQHALMRAWDHWEHSDPDGRPIERSDLEAVGGMAKALSRHAKEAFKSLACAGCRRVIAGRRCEDPTVILWDVTSRQPLSELLKGHQDVMYSVAFSPDGQTLASASRDRTVILWDVDVASWMRKACAIANRNLTHREWETYVGDDVPYQAPCPELPVPKD